MTRLPGVPSVRRVAGLVGGLVALTVLGASAVAVALPEMSLALALDTSGAAWVLASFSLSFAMGTAFFGRLADILGLRVPLRIGASTFAAGSLLAAVSPSFPVLIGGRLLQGLGAGAVPVLTMGIVAARFPGSARTRAYGALTAVVSIVSGSGPLIAGLITELMSWRGVFALPAIAVVLAEPVARIAPAGRPEGGRFDAFGAALVAISVVSTTVFLQSPSAGRGPLVAGASAGIAILAVALLVRRMKTRPAGFIPALIGRNPKVIQGGIVGGSLLAAYIGLLLAAPLLLAAEHGWRTLQIGLGLMPAAGAGALGSRLISRVLRPGRHRRFGIRVAGLAVLGLLLASTSYHIPAVLLLAVALVAIASFGGQLIFLDLVAGDVTDEVRGAALGTFHLVLLMGGAVGAATVGGLSRPFSIPAALALLALLPCGGALLAARGGLE